MRSVQLSRKTNETDITLALNLDGTGAAKTDTGVGFLDHMLTLLARHGGVDLTVTCKGDLYVDAHHTTEDVGIVLGKAIAQALGDKAGIARYASEFVPMDEALVAAHLDVSGRPYLANNINLQGSIGNFDCELVEEFFRAVCTNAGLTLHLRMLDGVNRHHIIEAAFKAFGRALGAAVKVVGTQIPSTKGVL